MPAEISENTQSKPAAATPITAIPDPQTSGGATKDEKATLTSPAENETVRILKARRPMRELEACCRTILMLQFHVLVYNDALNAKAKYLPFRRMNDLGHAIVELEVIWASIVEDKENTSALTLAWRKWSNKHWPPAIKGHKIAHARRVYVRQLLTDLNKVREALNSRSLPYLCLQQSIDFCIAPDTIEWFKYRRGCEQPLNLTSDVMHFVQSGPNQEDGDGHAMEQVKRKWKQLMTNYSPIEAKYLPAVWNRCVTGIPVILEGEPQPGAPNYVEDTAKNPLPEAIFKQPSPIPEPAQVAEPPVFTTSRTMEVPLSEPYEQNIPFLVVGWFPGKLQEPIEICVQVEDVTCFLSELHEAIQKSRGWRYYLSLKTVDAFGLYKVSSRIS